MKRQPITEEELEAIHRAIGGVHYANYVYAQCALGLRPGQFVALKKTDVSRKDGRMYLTIRGKEVGGDRRILLSPEIEEIVESRLRQYSTEYLFPVAGCRGGSMVGWRPMSVKFYNNHMFKPVMASLGIAEGKTPVCASLRHFG